MKVVAWNARGVGRPNFVSQTGKLLKNMVLDILFLSESKINTNRTLNNFPRLQFNCYHLLINRIFWWSLVVLEF